MTEAVVAATARTPIGRANKGSLVVAESLQGGGVIAATSRSGSAWPWCSSCADPSLAL